MLLHVFIASSRDRTAQRIAHMIGGEDVRVTVLAEPKTMERRLERETCDVLLLDDDFVEDTSTMIAEVRALPSGPEVVVLSWSKDPARATEMLAGEALAVVYPKTSEEELSLALRAILERRTEQLQQEIAVEEAEEEPLLSNYVTKSPAMGNLLSLVRRVVKADSTLLILGETGVGKEHLSRAIHAEGPRASGPFMAVNCAALSEGVLESELFGHVEGAFTGAVRARRGYLELAHQGTLFLDEIGELPPLTQVKLLRFLQDHKIQPVGSEEEVEVDVRLVTATNRDLHGEMVNQRFRPDLYYRLSVVTLQVPPLRERREDIPSLVGAYIERFAHVLQKNVKGLDPAAMELLVRYDWPGNVRELANVMERAVLLLEGDMITRKDLPRELLPQDGPVDPMVVEGTREQAATRFEEGLANVPFLKARGTVLDSFERFYIERVLERCHGRVRDAAILSGINPRTLYEKMQRLGIRKEHFKLPPKSS